jgi:hypothetical protein
VHTPPARHVPERVQRRSTDSSRCAVLRPPVSAWAPPLLPVPPPDFAGRRRRPPVGLTSESDAAGTDPAARGPRDATKRRRALSASRPPRAASAPTETALPSRREQEPRGHLAPRVAALRRTATPAGALAARRGAQVHVRFCRSFAWAGRCGAHGRRATPKRPGPGPLVGRPLRSCRRRSEARDGQVLLARAPADDGCTTTVLGRAGPLLSAHYSRHGMLQRSFTRRSLSLKLLALPVTARPLQRHWRLEIAMLQAGDGPGTLHETSSIPSTNVQPEIWYW